MNASTRQHTRPRNTWNPRNTRNPQKPNTARAFAQGLMCLVLVALTVLGVYPGGPAPVWAGTAASELELRLGADCQDTTSTGVGAGARSGAGSVGREQHTPTQGSRRWGRWTHGDSGTGSGGSSTPLSASSQDGCDRCVECDARNNGDVVATMRGVSSPGGSGGLLYNLTWSNYGDEPYDTPEGNSTVGLPWMLEDTTNGRFQVVLPGGVLLVFDDTPSSGVYSPDCADSNYDGIMLEDDGDNLKLTLMVGTEPVVYVFRDFTQTTYPQGQFVSYTTWGETVEAYAHTTGNKISGVRRKVDGVTMEYLDFTYFTTGVNTDKIKTATIRSRNGDSGASMDYISRIRIDYYGASDTNGNLNDIKRIRYRVSTDGTATWEDTGRLYLRHQTPGVGAVEEYKGIEYIVNPEAYARMVADSITPETATDAELDDYADYIFEWQNGDTDGDNDVDGNDEAWKEGLLTEVSGASCGGCGGLSGTVKEHGWELNSNWSGASDRYDDWWRKHVEETKEGATVIRREVTYINRAGSTILRVVEDWEDGGDLNRARGWFTHYNSDGYPTIVRQPDALTLPLTSGEVDYSDVEDEDDLNGGNSVTLNATTGVVRITTYEATTTATTTTPGNVAGYGSRRQIFPGQLKGSAVTLDETLYIEHWHDADDDATQDADEPSIYVVAEVRAYVDGSTYNTTELEYTWREDGNGNETNQIESVTRTVYGAEGSTAAADALESVEVRDELGRTTWTKDPRGVIRHMEYDDSGRLTKVIDDVDTTGVSDEPAGWSSGGDHLVTDTTYDDQGRVTLVLGPEHDVLVGGVGGTSDTVRGYRQMLYIDNEDDENDEVWSASGYYDVSATTYHQVGAVQVSIRDKAGRSVESITAERDPGSGGGLLVATENYTTRSRWHGWSKSVYNDAGQMTERVVYTDIDDAGVTDPDTDGHDGSADTHYLLTSYGYNDDGTTQYVEGPDGTRHYTFRAFKSVGGSDYWENRRYTLYDGTGSDDWYLAGPISVSWTDVDGRTARSFIATTSTGLGTEVADDNGGSDGVPDGDDTLTALSRSATTYDWRGRTLERWSYFDITGLAESADGTEGTHYVVSEVLAYDEQGRVLRAQSPSGDISATVYDGLGRTIETWVGTDDTGATRTDPSDSGGNDMVLVSQAFYDDVGDGTGDATLELVRAERLKPNLTGALDGSSDEFTGVTYVYDDRGRRTDTKPDVGPWSHVDYNTIGQVEKAITYENGGSPTTNADLLAQSETIYDEVDRVSASRVYEVDGAAAPTKYLQSSVAYDDLGRQALSFNAQGAGTLTQWDDAGRVVRQVLFSDNGGDDTDPSDDIVVTETVIDYIATGTGAGRPYLRASYQRNHDANAATDDLLSTQASIAQRTYAATWYDEGGRVTHTAYYGHNGHAALSDYDPATGNDDYDEGPPSPDSSDDVIVTQTDYDDATRVDQVTANDGVVTKFFYNDAGQRTHVVENYDAGELTNGPDDPDDRDADVNRVTAFVYDHQLGAVVQQIAVDPDHDGDPADSQTTRYVYSVELTDKGTPGGGLQSNSLLRAVIYPDSDDTVTSSALADGTDATHDRVELTYYSDGTLRTREDQNGTVLTSLYHDDGALEYQDATTLGTNIDGAVRSMGYAYDELRRVTTVTQYDDVSTGSPTAINQVVNAYTDLGQLEEQFQEHDGTKDGSTLSIGYEYDTTLSNNVYNEDRRLNVVVYPDDRHVFNRYNSNGTVSHELGIVIAIGEDNGSGVDGSQLTRYKYFGTSGLAEVRFQQPTNAVVLTYHQGDSDGDYEGYDQFYRMTDQYWEQTGASPARVKYGYDRGSRRVYHEDVLAATNSQDLDQLDTRNAFGELTHWELGGLDSGLDDIPAGDRDATQDWTLDQLGNWADFHSDTNGDEDFTDDDDLDQARTANDVNEITGITELGNQTVWATPAYDRSGNMTEVPQPNAPANSYDATYDAWGRLVKLETSGGGANTVAEYEYDGLGRRIIKHVYDNGTFDYSDHSYYNGWQVIEVRRDTDSTKGGDPDADPMEQFAYHTYYIDAVAVRYWDDPDDGGGLDGTQAEQYYAHDAQFNVIALMDDTGTVIERYRYAPYGEQTVMDASYSTKSGGTDYAQYKGFTGQTLDPESGLWYFRSRYYHAGLGTFTSVDPKQYIDGMNLRAGYFGLLASLDPMGRQAANQDNIVSPTATAIFLEEPTMTLERGLHFEWLLQLDLTYAFKRYIQRTNIVWRAYTTDGRLIGKRRNDIYDVTTIDGIVRSEESFEELGLPFGDPFMGIIDTQSGDVAFLEFLEDTESNSGEQVCTVLATSVIEWYVVENLQYTEEGQRHEYEDSSPRDQVYSRFIIEIEGVDDPVFWKEGEFQNVTGFHYDEALVSGDIVVVGIYDLTTASTDIIIEANVTAGEADVSGLDFDERNIDRAGRESRDILDLIEEQG